MSAGFWLRSFFVLAAGALFVLGVAYEERLIAFEQNIAARWRRAWVKSFGESSGVAMRPANIQPRAVSYRTRISTQIEIIPGAVRESEFDPGRRKDIAAAAEQEEEAAVKSA